MKQLLLCVLCLCGITGELQAQIFDDYKVFSVSSGSGEISIVRFSPQSEFFAIGNGKGRIVIRKTANTRIHKIIQAHKGAIRDINFHPSQEKLASVGENGNVKLWNLKTGQVLFDLAKSNPELKHSLKKFVFFDQKGDGFYFGGGDGKLYFMSYRTTPQRAKLVTRVGKVVDDIAINSNRSKMLAASLKEVALVDLQKNEVVQRVNACSKRVVDVQFNPNETQMACLCENGLLNLYDIQTGALVHSNILTSLKQTEFDFSKDGKCLVIGDSGDGAKVYDLEKKNVISELMGHYGSVRTVHFSHDGQFILSAGDGQFTKMWKYKKIYQVEELPTPPTPPSKPTTPIATNTQPTNPPVPKASNPPSPKVTKPESPQKPKMAKTEIPLEDFRLTFDENIPDSLGNRAVRTGKRVLVKTDELTFVVWDSEIVDGDTISLYFNGQWLLKEHALTAKKKKIKVKINPEADNYLILHAHNEGTRSPNTAALTVDDGILRKRVALSSDMGTSDAINFKKQ